MAERTASPQQRLELLAHLVGREFRIRHRRSLLGWAWAVIQPLTRLAIFTFVFTQVVPLEIDDYPAFLFTGLIAWSWFSTGILSATTSPFDHRFMLFRPGVPRFVVPVVSVASDTVDFLLSLPVLLVAVAVVTGGLPPTVVLLPVLAAAQFLLVLGLGSLLSVVDVYARDVRRLVEIALVLGFYVTPVFYQPEQIPERFAWVVDLNPMAALIGGYRQVVLDGTVPDLGRFAVVALACAATAAAGYLAYRRFAGRFVDEL